jgi:hypothetical protein
MAGDETKITIEVQERIELTVSASIALPGSDGEHRLQQKYGKTTHALAFYK